MQTPVKPRTVRDLSIDAASGLLILWMMFGHTMTWSHISTPAYEAVRTAMSFYLAWFFFKGGLFAKKAPNEMDYFRVSLRRLVVPFIIFTAIGMLFYWLDLYVMGERSRFLYVTKPWRYFIRRGAAYGNLPLWFLLTLFFVRTLFQRLVRFRYADWLMGVVILLLYLVKYLDFFGVAHNMVFPHYLYNSIVGLLFFWVGYRLKQQTYDRRLLIASVIILIPLLVFIRPNYFFRSSIVEGDFMVFLLKAVAECIVFTNLFRLLYRHFQMRFLIYVGEHAMEYFAIHWILLYLLHIAVVVPFTVTNQLALLCIYIFGLALLLPAVSAILARTSIKL